MLLKKWPDCVTQPYESNLGGGFTYFYMFTPKNLGGNGTQFDKRCIFFRMHVPQKPPYKNWVVSETAGYWPFAKYHVSGPGAVAFMDRLVPNRCRIWEMVESGSWVDMTPTKIDEWPLKSFFLNIPTIDFQGLCWVSGEYLTDFGDHSFSWKITLKEAWSKRKQDGKTEDDLEFFRIERAWLGNL